MKMVNRLARRQAFHDGNVKMNDMAIETARELATHANDIQHLQADMDKMVQEMSEIKTAIQSIEKTLSEAKGGWKTLVAIGGAMSLLTGIIGVFIGYWGNK
jgi:prefoldin subunit 5